MTNAILGALLLAGSAQADPRAIVRAMFAAFNAHDARRMTALYAPDAKLDSSDFCKTRTGRDVKRTYESLFSEIPDIHDAIDTILVDGNRVAVRFTATSAKTGFRLPIVTILRVDGGLIVEDDSRFDNGGRACIP